MKPDQYAPPAKQDKSYPLPTVVLAYLTSLESRFALTKNTRLAYQFDLQDFMTCTQAVENRPLTVADFNRVNVLRYLAIIRQRNRQPKTILRHMASLRHFEAYLIDEGYLDTHDEKPCAAFPKLTSNAHPRRHQLVILTEQHLQAINDLLDSSPRLVSLRDKAILDVMLGTGLSVNELINLDLIDLDLRSRQIHLCTRQNEDHWLPLVFGTLSLEKYIHEGRPELHPSPDQPALFISQTGARMSRQGVWQVLGHLGRAAALPFALSPRIIRHSAVTRLMNAKLPVRDLQLLLGHRNSFSTKALLHRLRQVKE